MKWTSASALAVAVFGFLRIAVLAHLLTQDDFGLMGMVLTVLGFAQVYADVGFSNAIVYRQDATHQQLSSLYWANILVSLAIMGIVIAVAPLAAAFYQEPRVTAPLRLAAVTYLLAPLGQQFLMLLQRELMFRVLAVLEIVAAITGLAVGIVTALAGQGVYSLVWAHLAAVGAKSIGGAMVGWARWRPSLRLVPSDLRGFISFGAYQMGERSIDYLTTNLDYILIGRFLGSEPLGVYTIAWQLVVAPLTKLNPVLTRVAFPVFAKRQHDVPALLRGYYELTELVALVAFPLLLGLAVTASVAVPVLVGSRWEDSILVLQCLTPMALLWTIGNPAGALLLARGRADVGFWWNLFRATVVFGVLFVAVRWGVVAVAIAHSIVSVALLPISLVVMHRVVEMDWRAYLASLRRPSALAAILAAVTAGALLLLEPIVANRPALLAVLVAIGAIAYISLWLIWWPDYIRGLWQLVARREAVI